VKGPIAGMGKCATEGYFFISYCKKKYWDVCWGGWEDRDWNWGRMV